jgi:hypothetical protein
MLEPSANDRQLAVARSGGADLVAAGFILIDEQGRVLDECPWVACDDFIAQQLDECDSSHYSAYLFRRAFVASIPHRQEYGALDDRQFILEVAFKGPKVCAVDAPTLRHRRHHRGRLQSTAGLADIVKQWQHYRILHAAARELEARAELTQRRRRAVAQMAWPRAKSIAFAHIDDGVRIADWACELDPDLRIPERPSVTFLYRRLGFRKTAQLRSLWRTAKRLTGRGL